MESDDKIHICEQQFDALPVRINAHPAKVQYVSIAVMVVITAVFAVIACKSAHDPYHAAPLSFFAMCGSALAAIFLSAYFLTQQDVFVAVVVNLMQKNDIPALQLLENYQQKTSYMDVLHTFKQYGTVYGVVVCVGVYWAFHNTFACFMYIIAQAAIAFAAVLSEYDFNRLQCSDLIAIAIEKMSWRHKCLQVHLSGQK